MKKSILTAFYGGTFDPIHNGHIKSAIALAKLIHLNRIILIPNGSPVHKPIPVASAEDRINMINLAISEISEDIFEIDYREINNKIPSYTINTFENLRKEYGPKAPLGFILGQDSFMKLHTWYRGYDILKFCHLLICARSNNMINLKKIKFKFIDPKILHYIPFGLIYYAFTPIIKISSRNIRLRYKFGISCNGLISSSVQKYINKKNIYKR
ncbi:ybeN [Wigglesworthia glossinidia endosymbiont of Glossina brevipalpis]|uniref:Probable nicotinate-nucleotide adenylyltransferase n=1 Tax=Wigglesworthia glossinidia brevipalpis TaxID=36870 RepID=NADD_WIGBR|nr:RecName: Full=Probable nicotinate-nucleotide adenylyltransferase; AltName: Full=Deamido-NAD(+) diphosphorylase; AltName: Full=Deamido-NAD(+) pyrophosphorylase; AltName: Full=Nicotinate mononucleotide adenylyltransferase; Short=NaMN adenylyltransferase [Wigglesworthia glossinidia endosymbiont of Glossina brevipalpis]BAC24317.1 ybeN [Wigglesworthia glossinidia endosymbiont of Glossina brevipalpis]